jgi:hypothetical protein
VQSETVHLMVAVMLRWKDDVAFTVCVSVAGMK